MEQVLELDGVHKTFLTPSGAVDVLKGVDLTVTDGEFVGITGPSGAGKTTFLQLAALMDLPSRGRLRMCGVETTGLDDEGLTELRKRNVGMVFQNYHLLPGRTVAANVGFGFRYLGVDADVAREASRRAMDEMGIDAIAQRSARLLSGGEMQRTAIARAIAPAPRLLVADEPTGNLDDENTTVVMEHFARLNDRGMTILLVTHDRSLLSYCSRHLECRAGLISEEGRVPEGPARSTRARA